MAGLPREVLKWLQSLDLTWQVQNAKWDLSNGYLLGEIFSWYYPNQIYLHCFNKGSSYSKKSLNWDYLKDFFRKHKISIPNELIEGTIHCKEGAANSLIIFLYEMLTNRQVKRSARDHESEFCDRSYQLRLPMHARATATKAVKNNISNTEILAYHNIISGQQQAQQIINRHLELRKLERIENPKRFGKKLGLGELAPRKPLPPVEQATPECTAEHPTRESTATSKKAGSARSSKLASEEGVSKARTSVTFKEVDVKQLGRLNHYQQPVIGY